MSKVITHLTVTDDICLINLTNLPAEISAAADILSAIAAADINVDMINQTPFVKSSSISFSFTILKDDLAAAMTVLGSFKAKFPKLASEIITDNTKLCVYGEYMPDKCGIAAEFFSIFKNNDIEIRLITTSVTDISVLIADHSSDEAINIIKSHYGI